MSNELLASKIVVVEAEPRVRGVPALQTGVAAMVGISERGPVATPTLLFSVADFRRVFGSLIAVAEAPLAVQSFFDNGGQLLWFTRTAHYTDITNPATLTALKGTINLQTDGGGPATAGLATSSNQENFNLEPGETLLISVDGGGDLTATFDAAAAQSLGTAGAFATLASETFEVQFENGSVQLITMGTETTQAAALNTINAQLLNGSAQVIDANNIKIVSDVRGTSSRVRLTNVAAGITTKLGLQNNDDVTGSGDVADIDAVTGAEAKTLIEADVAGQTVTVNGNGTITVTSNTTGVSSSIQFNASSTALTAFGFDTVLHTGTASSPVDTLKVDGKTEGAYTDNITIRITNATNAVAEFFNLSVLDSGVLVETFPNVTMDDANLAAYVENVVNDVDTGSDLVAVTDLDAAGDATAQRPVVATSTALTGGNDGLAALADADFSGDSAAKTGIRALDTVQFSGVFQLLIPDRATAAVHNAMITYCEVTRDKQGFAILDPPAGLDAVGIIAYVKTTAAIQRLSEHAIIFWPRVKVLNPSTTIFGAGESIVVAPSGAIAGVYARQDGVRPGGVYRFHAGTEEGILFGVIGFETDAVLEEAVRDLVFPELINPLTQSGPRFIDGARTLKDNGQFPTNGNRRGAIFIEQTIKAALEPDRQKPITRELRDKLDRTTTAFLLTQTKNGAFASTDPAKAFFVDFGDALNPPSEEKARRVNGRIGLAFTSPAEFIILEFSQDTRALDEELAAAT